MSLYKNDFAAGHLQSERSLSLDDLAASGNLQSERSLLSVGAEPLKKLEEYQSVRTPALAVAFLTKGAKTTNIMEEYKLVRALSEVTPPYFLAVALPSKDGIGTSGLLQSELCVAAGNGSKSEEYLRVVARTCAVRSLSEVTHCISAVALPTKDDFDGSGNLQSKRSLDAYETSGVLQSELSVGAKTVIKMEEYKLVRALFEVTPYFLAVALPSKVQRRFYGSGSSTCDFCTLDPIRGYVCRVDPNNSKQTPTYRKLGHHLKDCNCCYYCDRNFDTHKKMTDHQLVAHPFLSCPRITDPWICPICGNKFVVKNFDHECHPYNGGK